MNRADQDQSAKKVQSDLGSTLSDKEMFFSKNYARNSSIRVLAWLSDWKFRFTALAG